MLKTQFERESFEREKRRQKFYNILVPERRETKRLKKERKVVQELRCQKKKEMKNYNSKKEDLEEEDQRQDERDVGQGFLLPRILLAFR